MTQLSNAMRALEARTSALELEFARLSERLRTVGAALGGAEPARTTGRKSAVSATPAEPQAQAAVKAPAGGARKAAPSRGPRVHSWFRSGEAQELFVGILKKPMRSSDLIARVVVAKRKGQLPTQDMERFKWAIKAALKQAIKNQSIVRQDDGLLAAAAAREAVKPARKPAK